MGHAPDAARLAAAGAAGVYRAAVAGDRRLLADRASGAAGFAAVDCTREAGADAAEHACSSTSQQLFHFMRFGNAMLDKVASWRGELKFKRDVVFAPGASETLNIAAPQGKLLLASHLGDVEACRALAQLDGSKTINARSSARTPGVLSKL